MGFRQAILGGDNAKGINHRIGVVPGQYVLGTLFIQVASQAGGKEHDHVACCYSPVDQIGLHARSAAERWGRY